MYFFRYIFNLSIIGFRFLYKRRQIEFSAGKALGKLEEELGGAFQLSSKKKIILYNSLNQMVSIDNFNKIYGRKSSKELKQKLFNYSILNVLFDGFFDEKTHSIEQIRSMTYNPGQYKAVSFEEKVFLKAGIFLLENVRDKSGYMEVCKNTVEGQFASLDQFDENIDFRRLEEITFEKGGWAFCLCWFYLDYEITENEKKCWYLLGGIMQLATDVFDIYRDLQAGIQTIPIKLRSAYQLEKLFLEKTNEVKDLIRKFPASNRKKEEFCMQLMLIISFGLIGISQLKDIQGDKDMLPELKSIPRKLLIIDMEKLSNWKRWLVLSYDLCKLSNLHKT